MEPVGSHGLTEDEISILVAESCREQGVPRYVEDPVVLGRVLALLDDPEVEAA